MADQAGGSPGQSTSLPAAPTTSTATTHLAQESASGSLHEVEHERSDKEASPEVQQCNSMQCHKCPQWPNEVHHLCPVFIKAIVDALADKSRREREEQQKKGKAPGARRRQQPRRQPAQARRGSSRPIGVTKPSPSSQADASGPRVIMTRARTRAQALAQAQAKKTRNGQQASQAKTPAGTGQVAGQSTSQDVPEDEPETPEDQINVEPTSRLISAITTHPIPTTTGRPRGVWGASRTGSPFQRVSGTLARLPAVASTASENVDDNENYQQEQPASPGPAEPKIDDETTTPTSTPPQTYWQPGPTALQPRRGDDVFATTSTAPGPSTRSQAAGASVGSPPRSNAHRELAYGPAQGQAIPPPAATIADTSTNAPQPSVLEQFNLDMDAREAGQSPRYSPQDSPPPVNRRLDFTQHPPIGDNTEAEE